MLIDSHVNLHAPQFDDDRRAVIDRARTAGVRLMVNISDRVSHFDKVRALANEPDIWCTVGTHPHEAKEDPEIAKNAPYSTPVRRLDEGQAARKPVVRQPRAE